MPEGSSSVYSSLSVRWTVLCVTRLIENGSLVLACLNKISTLLVFNNKLLCVPLLPPKTEVLGCLTHFTNWFLILVLQIGEIGSQI